MIKSIILIFLSGFSIIGLSQTNYYISSTGNNSNNGMMSTPWLTIQFGLNQLANGDTLNLETGNYNEKIQIPTNGITLRNKFSHTPIIDAIGLTSQVSVVEVYDVSDFTIDGIEIQNNIMIDAQGILVENNCQNITIKNCKIHDIHFSSNINAPINSSTNAQGIIVYGTDENNTITNLSILNNELYDCRLGYSEGIAVNGNVDGFEVSGNLVHDITNIGLDFIGFEGTSSNSSNDQARNGLVKNNIVYNCISPYATSGGIYIDGGKNIIVENNTAYHNGYGIEIGCENVGKTTENITVRNNIFYDNEVAALAFGGFDYPAGSGKVINSSFRNNTCYYNDYSNESNGEMYLSYTENCFIENNIFYATTQNLALYQDGSPQNLTLNYNVYYSDATGLGINFDYAGNTTSGVVNFNASTGHGANSAEVNPNFLTPSISSPDFHIQAGSPAINAGNHSFTAAAGEKDMDNENRTNGTVDCGADEHYLATEINTLEFGKEELKIYPNPSTGIFNIDANGLVEIVVTNMFGEIVLKPKNKLVIDLSKFRSGIYFVKALNKGSHPVVKIIKH